MDTTELEEKVASNLKQIRLESDIFMKLMYKNKNQHRRCLYYKALLRVRRDLKLFQDADVDKLLKTQLDTINANSKSCKNEQKHVTVKYNFRERFLGVLWLLEQMTEPIIEAGLKVSTLLGQSFFMQFAMMMLALLARLRVLFQQVLHDLVKIFNQLTMMPLHEQSTKLSDKGIAILQDFSDYRQNQKTLLTFECQWNESKFCLVKKFVESEEYASRLVDILPTKHCEDNNFQETIDASLIKYDRVPYSVEETSTNASKPKDDGFQTSKKGISAEISLDRKTKENIHGNYNVAFQGNLENNTSGDSDSAQNTVYPERSEGLLNSGSKRNVAFIPVSLDSANGKLNEPNKRLKKECGGKAEKDLPEEKTNSVSLFDLLFTDMKQDSLF